MEKFELHNQNSEQAPISVDGVKAKALSEVVGSQPETFLKMQKAISESENELKETLKNEPDFIAPEISSHDREIIEKETAEMVKKSKVTLSKPKSSYVEVEGGLPPIAILDCNVTGLGIKRLDEALDIKMKHFDAVIMAYMLWLANSDNVKWDDFKKSTHIFSLGEFPRFGEGFKGVFLTGSKFNPFANKEEDYGFNPDNLEEKNYAQKFIREGVSWVNEWLKKANKNDADIPWLGGSCGGFQLVCAGAGGTGKKEKSLFGVYDVEALPEMKSHSLGLAERFKEEGGSIPIVHGNSYLLDKLDHPSVKPIAKFSNDDVAAVGLGKNKGFLFQGHPELPTEIISGLLKDDKWGKIISKMLIEGGLESNSQVGKYYDQETVSLGEAESLLKKMSSELKPTAQSHLILRNAYQDLLK